MAVSHDEAAAALETLRTYCDEQLGVVGGFSAYVDKRPETGTRILFHDGVKPGTLREVLRRERERARGWDAKKGGDGGS